MRRRVYIFSCILLPLLAVQLWSWPLRVEGDEGDVSSAETRLDAHVESEETQLTLSEPPWMSKLRSSMDWHKCTFLIQGPLKDWFPNHKPSVFSRPRWRLALPSRREAWRVSRSVGRASDLIRETRFDLFDDDDSFEREETDEEFVPPTSDDLAPTTEELEEAMAKVCSPSTEKELLDTLGDAVGGGINSVDGWMSSLLGSVGSNERDYTLLQGFLLGENGLLDVIKGNYLFLIAIASAAVLLVVFLLFCVPKLCCPCARKLCCCCRSCRSANFAARLLQLIVSAAVSILALIFLCLAISYTAKSLRGAKQLHCQVFKFADEILQGTSTSTEEILRSLASQRQPMPLLESPGSAMTVASSEEEGAQSSVLPGGETDGQQDEETAEKDDEALAPFVGLVPLLRETESLAELVDGKNPQNLLETAKRVALEKINIQPLQSASLSAAKDIQSICETAKTLPLEKDLKHRVLWCLYAEQEEYKTSLKEMDVSMECIVAAEQTALSPKVESLFKDIKLPTLNIAESIPTESIYGLFSTASSMLSKTEEPVSKVLSLLQVGLNIDSAIALVIVLLAAAWTVWFFLLGTRARSPLVGALWFLVYIITVVVVIFAGAIGWTSTLGLQACSMVVDELLGNDNWSVLVKYAPVVEPLLQQCLYKEANGDMLQAVGLDTMFADTISTLKQTFNSLPTNSLNLDQATSAKASLLLQRSNEFGPLVALDPDQLSQSQKDVFPEFLTSGLQQRDVALPNGHVLYGLETLQSLVSPFQLKALQVDAQVQASLQWKALASPSKETTKDATSAGAETRASALTFVIDETNPAEDDPAFLEWLGNLKTEKEKEFEGAGKTPQDAKAAASDFVTKTKNAIWILQQKQKALSGSIPCSDTEDSEAALPSLPKPRGRLGVSQNRFLRQIQSRVTKTRQRTTRMHRSTCSFQQMFGVASEEMSRSIFYRRQQQAALNYLGVSGCVTNAVEAARAELFDAVDRLENVREGLNCRFLRRNVLQTSLVMCNQFIENLYKVGIYRALAGGAMFLIALLLTFLWRIIKNSRGAAKSKNKGGGGGGGGGGDSA